MNSLARVGLIILIAGLAMGAALLVRAQGMGVSAQEIPLGPRDTAYVAQFFQARLIEARISDPLVFNATLAIYANDDAEDHILGKSASAVATFTFRGPATVSFESAERGAHLVVLKNLDARAVVLRVSYQEQPGIDSVLSRTSATFVGIGFIIGLTGVVMPLSRRGTRA